MRCWCVPIANCDLSEYHAVFFLGNSLNPLCTYNPQGLISHLAINLGRKSLHSWSQRLNSPSQVTILTGCLLTYQSMYSLSGSLGGGLNNQSLGVVLVPRYFLLCDKPKHKCVTGPT